MRLADCRLCPVKSLIPMINMKYSMILELCVYLNILTNQVLILIAVWPHAFVPKQGSFCSYTLYYATWRRLIYNVEFDSQWTCGSVGSGDRATYCYTRGQGLGWPIPKCLWHYRGDLAMPVRALVWLFSYSDSSLLTTKIVDFIPIFITPTPKSNAQCFKSCMNGYKSLEINNNIFFPV